MTDCINNTLAKNADGTYTGMFGRIISAETVAADEARQAQDALLASVPLNAGHIIESLKQIMAASDAAQAAGQSQLSCDLHRIAADLARPIVRNDNGESVLFDIEPSLFERIYPEW